MDSALTKHQKNVATVIHVATFGKYFFPFGNFLFPFIFWAMYKKDSAYIDHHGKEALNFQLSLFCYKILGAVLTIPFFLIFQFHHYKIWDVFRFNNITIDFNDSFNFHSVSFVGFLIMLGHFLFFAFNITYTIIAAMKANEGEKYKYPLTIRFIK